MVRGAWRMVVCAAAALALTGCGGPGAPPPVAEPTASPPAVNPLLTEAYKALPDCPSLPAAIDLPEIEGLYLPDEAVISSSRPTGPLTQVQGFVGMTPIQFRLYYQERDDLEIISVEDEGFEAEILVSDGKNRMFAKAQAFCSEGSNMIAVVAPEAAADAVPVPAGSPTPPAP